MITFDKKAFFVNALCFFCVSSTILTSRKSSTNVPNVYDIKSSIIHNIDPIKYIENKMTDNVADKNKEDNFKDSRISRKTVVYFLHPSNSPTSAPNRNSTQVPTLNPTPTPTNTYAPVPDFARGFFVPFQLAFIPSSHTFTPTMAYNRTRFRRRSSSPTTNPAKTPAPSPWIYNPNHFPSLSSLRTPSPTTWLSNPNHFTMPYHNYPVAGLTSTNYRTPSPTPWAVNPNHYSNPLQIQYVFPSQHKSSTEMDSRFVYHGPTTLAPTTASPTHPIPTRYPTNRPQSSRPTKSSSPTQSHVPHHTPGPSPWLFHAAAAALPITTQHPTPYPSKRLRSSSPDSTDETLSEKIQLLGYFVSPTSYPSIHRPKTPSPTKWYENTNRMKHFSTFPSASPSRRRRSPYPSPVPHVGDPTQSPGYTSPPTADEDDDTDFPTIDPTPFYQNWIGRGNQNPQAPSIPTPMPSRRKRSPAPSPIPHIGDPTRSPGDTNIPTRDEDDDDTPSPTPWEARFPPPKPQRPTPYPTPTNTTRYPTMVNETSRRPTISPHPTTGYIFIRQWTMQPTLPLPTLSPTTSSPSKFPVVTPAPSPSMYRLKYGSTASTLFPTIANTPAPTPWMEHVVHKDSPSPSRIPTANPVVNTPAPTPWSEHEIYKASPSPSGNPTAKPVVGTPAPTPWSEHEIYKVSPSPSRIPTAKPVVGTPAPTPWSEHVVHKDSPSPSRIPTAKPVVKTPAPTPWSEHEIYKVSPSPSRLPTTKPASDYDTLADIVQLQSYFFQPNSVPSHYPTKESEQTTNHPNAYTNDFPVPRLFDVMEPTYHWGATRYPDALRTHAPTTYPSPHPPTNFPVITRAPSPTYYRHATSPAPVTAEPSQHPTPYPTDINPTKYPLSTHPPSPLHFQGSLTSLPSTSLPTITPHPTPYPSPSPPTHFPVITRAPSPIYYRNPLEPTRYPTRTPSPTEWYQNTPNPTKIRPTDQPSPFPTLKRDPTSSPTIKNSPSPTTLYPTSYPSYFPSKFPVNAGGVRNVPTLFPTRFPLIPPSDYPTEIPSTSHPTISNRPTLYPTSHTTTYLPTTYHPAPSPTYYPSPHPTDNTQYSESQYMQSSSTLYPTPWRFKIPGPSKSPDYTDPETLAPTPWLFNTAPTPFPTFSPSHFPTFLPTTPYPTPWQAHSEHGTISPSRVPTLPRDSEAPTPTHFNPKYLVIRPTPYPIVNPIATGSPTTEMVITLSPTPWHYNPHVETREPSPGPTNYPSEIPTSSPATPEPSLFPFTAPSEGPTTSAKPSTVTVSSTLFGSDGFFGIHASKIQWLMILIMMGLIAALIGWAIRLRLNAHQQQQQDDKNNVSERRELLDVSITSTTTDNASIHQLRAAMRAQFARPAPPPTSELSSLQMPTPSYLTSGGSSSSTGISIGSGGSTGMSSLQLPSDFTTSSSTNPRHRII